VSLRSTLVGWLMPARIRRLVRLNDLITGYWVTQAIYVAAKLGIADELRAGVKRAEDVALAVGADADALYRVMRALASVGILREFDAQKFALTDVGRQLESARPGSLRNWAIDNGEDWHWRSWGQLLHGVRTGKSAMERATGARFFDYLERDAEAASVFDAAMADLATIDNVSLVSGYPFARASTVVDVGGGSGALIASVLKTYPRLQGVLFDQPAVAHRARQRIVEASLDERCRVVEGDFFSAVPAGGDLYVLKQVVHDWDDARAVALLTNCAAAMSARARLLVIEIVVPDGPGPSIAKLTDLEMLVMTGGRERTADQYAMLLQRAGLRALKQHATRTPFTIIECVTDQSDNRPKKALGPC